MRSPVYITEHLFEDGHMFAHNREAPTTSSRRGFGPYEYEPIPTSRSTILDLPYDYYEQMTINIAKLAAWGKKTPQVLDAFERPSYPAAFFMGTAPRVKHYQRFLSEIATCLVPKEMRTEEDAKSMLRWLPEVEYCQRSILEYLFSDPNYCGFTHQNMNTDNASFWRDEEGKVQSGFIDWGRFKQDNFARGLTNGYMCCDLCEFIENDKKLVQSFADSECRGR